MSELAEEQELRDLFERFGRVTRVFLARDRETQRAKGFAFISFADRTDAARACEKMDGCEYLPRIPRTINILTSIFLQSVTVILSCASSLPSELLRFPTFYDVFFTKSLSVGLVFMARGFSFSLYCMI